MFAKKICVIVMFFGTCSTATSWAQVVETTASGERAIRVAVAHHEGKNQYGYGTMHISPSRIWFSEDSDKKDHSFEAPVASIEHARPGEQNDLRYLELRLANWKEARYYHHAPNNLVDTASPKVFAVAAAFENFEKTVQSLQGSLKDGTEPIPEPRFDENEEAIQHLVVRGEREGTYSYGWLNVYRDRLSYDVLWPPEMENDSWHINRSQIAEYRIIDRKGWRSVEIESRDGAIQVFANCQPVDFGFYVARPHSMDIFSVVRALDDFESSLAEAVGTINGPPPPPPPPCTGTVYIRSEPSGAEVWVDGVLMGSTPAKLTVNEGMRRVEVRLEGYTTWQREPSITCGSVVTLPVSLTKGAERE